MGIERRAYPRLPCELDVHIVGRDQTYALTTRDVSRGGVFVFHRDPLPLNQAVELTFSADDLELSVKGVVVHHLRGTGFGVQFGALDDESEAELSRFLDEVERSAA